MLRFRTLFVLLLLAFVCAGMAYSQAVNATLLGTVTDCHRRGRSERQSPHRGEHGSLPQRSDQRERKFHVPRHPARPLYRIGGVQGFKKEIRKEIEVVIDSTVRIDLRLQPGNVSETIEVTGQAPLLETDRADIGRSIDTIAVANLPLGTNRNFQALLNLVPGTAPATWQHSQFFNSAARCKPKSTARRARATTTRSRASTITSAPACSRSSFRRSKPSRPWMSPPTTSGTGPRRGRCHQRGAEIGHQQLSRRRLRVPPEQRFRRPRVLQPVGGPPGVQLLRRQHRRADQEEQDLLLRAITCGSRITKPTPTW